MNDTELVDIDFIRVPGQFPDQLFATKQAYDALRTEQLMSADRHFHNRRWESSHESRGAVDAIPTALLHCEVLEAKYRTAEGQQFTLTLDPDKQVLRVNLRE